MWGVSGGSVRASSTGAKGGQEGGSGGAETTWSQEKKTTSEARILAWGLLVTSSQQTTSPFQFVTWKTGEPAPCQRAQQDAEGTQHTTSAAAGFSHCAVRHIGPHGDVGPQQIVMDSKGLLLYLFFDVLLLLLSHSEITSECSLVNYSHEIAMTKCFSLNIKHKTTLYNWTYSEIKKDNWLEIEIHHCALKWSSFNLW